MKRSISSGSDGRQLPHLLDQHRHQQDERQDHQHGRHADDDRRGAEATEAERLQPVGEWIEEVGDHDGRDERQQDVLEQSNDRDEDDKRRQPEPELLFDAHDLPPPLPPQQGQSDDVLADS